jgi:hypothetical protein
MDAGIDATEWLESLTSMEQGWCRRLSLASEVVAFGRTDGVLSRVALEVEGPGAASTLAMEQGIHRLHRPRGRDFRARVDVIACSGADTNAASETGGIWPVRGEASALGITPDCGTRIEWQSAGRVIELFAENRSMLQRLASDLAIAELAGPDELQPARAYAKDGVGARDPRTGVTIARMKDAMAGKLDTFLEAWRQRSSLLPPPARSTQA